MKKISLLLIVLTGLLFACQPTLSPEVTKAWDEMMVVHDEVMPEMSTIKKLQKTIKAMPQDSSTAAILGNLDTAGKGMWDWMHGLKPKRELKGMAEAEALDYLKKTTEEISEVKVSMLSSIKQGQELVAAQQ